MKSNKAFLKTLTEGDIKRLYDKQCETNHWSFSDEREHMENIFCQRLNFLIVVYALIIAGLAATSDRHLFVGILYIGTAITLLMGLSVWRVCSKLLIMFTICYRIDKHPMALVDAENKTKKAWLRGIPVNGWMGYAVPAVCFVSLVIGLCSFWLGIIGPKP